MNSFGRVFRITIFGESHGPYIGVSIDGVKPGVPLKVEDFEQDLKRRMPENPYVTKRKEKDELIIASGIFNDKTTGAPLTILLKNEDIDSTPYRVTTRIPRPSHADLVAKIKYKGFNDNRGGGIFSARLTSGLVAAGVVAKKILENVKIESKIISIGGFPYPSEEVEKLLERISKEGDSLGGAIRTKIENLPIGIGEPYFDGIESYLSHILFSIPSLKAISFGNGIESAGLKGSEYIDSIIDSDGKTKTNNSGGINGGISNGNEILFTCFFHPVVSIRKEVKSYDFEKNEKVSISFGGRHDICHIFRLPVIVEACCAIVILDLQMINNLYIQNLY
ncbi:MAG TPA: chorismate synthase [Exilispira sp.]|nr:chorismate synthase [Exilispira sp.]